jgi:hypothetical protein
MQYPLLIVYESGRQLATWLREAAPIADQLRYDEEGKLTEAGHEDCGDARLTWLLREPRRPSACLRLLERGGSGVVVLHLGAGPEEVLKLLDAIAWRFPDAVTVVVVEEEHRSLAPLAWDLGATAVVVPPQVRERVQETVLGLMHSASAPETPVPSKTTEE